MKNILLALSIVFSFQAQAVFISAMSTVCPVQEVNGKTGTVVLDTDDIGEGLINLYYTPARARADLIASSISDSDTTHCPDGNSIFDAMALKQPVAYTPAVASDWGASVPTTVPQGIDGLAARQNCGVYSATLASNAATTGADLLPASAVPDGKKPYIVSHNGYVSGNAFFTGATECYLEDTSSVVFQTFDALDLIGDTTFEGLSIGVRADPYRKGTGGTDGAGIRVKCASNGAAGSSLFMNAMICIKP